MKIIPLDFADLSEAKVFFASCPLPSLPDDEVLIVGFEGEAGNSHEHCGTFTFMRAMITAGVVAWDPTAVVLDLRRLAYEWGDDMLRVLDVEGDAPVAVVVSDLNREGLTSLVEEEIPGRPEDWLFESIEEAVAAVDRAAIADRSPDGAP